MNVERKRHELLNLLNSQYNIFVTNENDENSNIKIPFGISKKEIFNKLNICENEFNTISSELYELEEIDNCDEPELDSIYILKSGLTSFANKKYLNRIFERKKDRIKFIVQTAIPVLALIVAILSLSTKFDSLKMQSDKELQKLEDKLLKQKMRIDSMELNPYNHQTLHKDMDSLKFEKRK